jgi:hypothetical protein
MKTQKWKLQLQETREGCEILEREPRYAVVLNGETVGQLRFNMRGYVGRLPQPSGIWLEMGESGISRFKQEVAAINREARLMAA